MKIILFGSTGMIGRYVLKYLEKTYDIITINRIDYDVESNDSDKLFKLLQKHNCNKDIVIINSIGAIPQRYDNTKINTYIKVNSIFPHLLIMVANILNAKLIHISTDCVFSGDVGNYTENDKHDEAAIYGLTKSIGEPKNCCIIRTSIIGEETSNKKSLLEWVKGNKNGTINGFVNHYWNGITCLELAKIIGKIIKTNMFWVGIRHIYSPKSVSKYELVSIINDVYKLGITINKHNTNKVDKTLLSVYTKMFDIPDIRDQIAEQFNFNIY